MYFSGLLFCCDYFLIAFLPCPVGVHYFQLSVVMEERDQLKRIVEDLKKRNDDEKGHKNYRVDDIQVERHIRVVKLQFYTRSICILMC